MVPVTKMSRLGAMPVPWNTRTVLQQGGRDRRTVVPTRVWLEDDLRSLREGVPGYKDENNICCDKTRPRRYHNCEIVNF